MIDLSIILPCYNETRRLPMAMAKLDTWINSQNMAVEIVIVENGSTDGTLDLAYTYQAMWTSPIQVLSIPENGKGRAVRAGMLAASGRLRLMCDVDFSTPVEAVGDFIYLSNGWPIVIATREGSAAERLYEPYTRHASGRVFNWLVQRLAIPGLRDTQCGFKLFHAAAAIDIFSRSTVNGWAFDVEILYLARLLDYKVIEYPVSWTYDPDSRVRMISDALKMTASLLKIRYNHLAGLYALSIADTARTAVAGQ